MGRVEAGSKIAPVAGQVPLAEGGLQESERFAILCELSLRAERSNLIIWTHLLLYRTKDLKIGTSSAGEDHGCGERLKIEVCRNRV